MVFLLTLPRFRSLLILDGATSRGIRPQESSFLVYGGVHLWLTLVFLVLPRHQKDSRAPVIAAVDRCDPRRCAIARGTLEPLITLTRYVSTLRYVDIL